MGADHNGFEMKAALLERLQRAGYDVTDKDKKQLDPDDDYPIAAARVIHAMRTSDDQDTRGILICGSGQGICMAANRFKGIRASLVWELGEARAARNDDDSNVLCLPARFITVDEAAKLAEAWLAAPFAGATRFKRRIKELDTLGEDF